MTTEYQIAKERAARYKERLDMLLESVSTEERKNTLANGQKGVSNWLTALPLKEHGLDLSKQEFRCHSLEIWLGT